MVRCIQRPDHLVTGLSLHFAQDGRQCYWIKFLVQLLPDISKSLSLGSDPLVRRLYEFEEQIEDPSHNLNPTTRSLWKYRRQVTVEHLGNAFQQADESFDNSQHKVLREFLKQVTAAAGPGSVFCTFFSHAEHSSTNQKQFLLGHILRFVFLGLYTLPHLLASIHCWG